MMRSVSAADRLVYGVIVAAFGGAVGGLGVIVQHARDPSSFASTSSGFKTSLFHSEESDSGPAISSFCVSVTLSKRRKINKSPSLTGLLRE